MLFTPLILLLPAVSHASWLPFRRGQPSNPEDCTVTSTLFPITVTSIHPTSTIGPHGSGSGSGSGSGGSNGSGGSGHSQVTGGGSLIYTTALPTLGPNGPGAHTYTITAPCASSDCQRPALTECPPGFTTTAVICHVCGELPVTTTLTLPIESATAAQGSHGGAAKAGSTLTAVVTAVIHKTVVPVPPAESVYPWISRGGPEMPDAQKPSQVPGGSDSKHDEAGKGDEIPDGPKNTGAPESPAGADTTATVDAPNGPSTAAGNQAGHGDGDEAGSESASSSDDASPSAVVVTSHAPETKVTRPVVIKAALFAAMVLYPLYV
ncbi:hypothetical protein NOF04DRAFT_9452 [Fusarium oxysporum II5]|uniref:Uncharacterized protein n=2 Tax=Fusarium oxysporum species complex TaxID=171631 RepID=X0JKC0_FUSO5|nr:uncharacterized protein FOIG_11139 [Fusarium odoratissimum NRRL 54006]EXL96780.1 hypothetical protein FOIG_11139 [Fusarium odoratissimum NRRL 54006]KAK2136067.1 hypothetical protein NOF04DRAFT_9452 [Fusarium oxysporum II5]TXC05109.1 hypothetical protein FocTR4_00000182 [Fusarium oxysporum f. sp. cubense]